MTEAREARDSGSSNSGAGHSASHPLEQLLALVGTLDPLDIASRAVDTSRRTTEALLTILENFASTVDNLNRTTSRINSLLDEVEEPLKRVMPQLGGAMNAMASMGDATLQLADLAKRLSPLTVLAENAGGLFGFRQTKTSAADGEATKPS